jgi:hypothetical protein
MERAGKNQRLARTHPHARVPARERAAMHAAVCATVSTPSFARPRGAPAGGR